MVDQHGKEAFALALHAVRPDDDRARLPDHRLRPQPHRRVRWAAAPDAPQFVKDYVDHYMRLRGFHARSGNSTDGWNATSSISWLNTNLLQFAHEIESAVMVLHGEKAHSRYMGEMIYEKLAGHNKGTSSCPVPPTTTSTTVAPSAPSLGRDRGLRWQVPVGGATSE